MLLKHYNTLIIVIVTVTLKNTYIDYQHTYLECVHNFCANSQNMYFFNETMTLGIDPILNQNRQNFQMS